MFDARELGILISGSSTGFNVSDLREHTVYAGGYTAAWQPFAQCIGKLCHTALGRLRIPTYLERNMSMAWPGRMSWHFQ